MTTSSERLLSDFYETTFKTFYMELMYQTHWGNGLIEQFLGSLTFVTFISIFISDFLIHRKLLTCFTKMFANFATYELGKIEVHLLRPNIIGFL